MGVPSLVLILAENQRPIAEGLDQAGAAVNLGWCTDIPIIQMAQALIQLSGDLATRSDMAQRGRGLVDGGGSTRLIAAISR